MFDSRTVTGILVLKILVRGTKIFNLLAENFGPGPKFSIDNPEKNGPPLKILVRGGRIRFNFLCCVTATNKQSGIIEIEVVGHKLQQCKGVGACAAPGDRESSGPFAAIPTLAGATVTRKQRRASSMEMIVKNKSSTINFNKQLEQIKRTGSVQQKSNKPIAYT